MAEYDLKRVKAAAQNLDIEYRGRKVSRDIANLGYEITDVARCLCQLTAQNFRKTHFYNNQAPDDEYICLYQKESEPKLVDELYIKFSMIDNYLIVDIGSFHLPQF